MKNEVKQKILVIGGAGLIGSTLVAALKKRNCEVVVADLAGKNSDKKSEKSTLRFVDLDIFVPGALDTLLLSERPSVIVNTVNLATILSSNQGEGYQTIVTFYARLYETLAQFRSAVHYIQVGTTGSGGLGFNIPFTHGENLEQRPIIHKAAFSGITSQLLVMLSRSFVEDSVKISEIKPGLAIFNDTIFTSTIAGATCVTLDGGESGHYTYNELALLTKMMGFTTVDSIVEKILAIIDTKKAVIQTKAFDLTSAMNRTIISESKVDTSARKKLLKTMYKQQGKYSVIATGNLGPKTVTAALIQAYMRLRGVTLLDPDPSLRATIAYLTQKDLALAEYIETACAKVIPLQLSDKGKEPWEIAEW